MSSVCARPTSATAGAGGVGAGGPDPAVGTLEQALAHAARLLQRDPRLAVEQLDEILRIVPGQPAALRMLAGACAQTADPTRAVAAWRQLAAVTPHSAEAHAGLGAALLQAGETGEAITVLRRAAACDRDLPEVWRLLADALWTAGQRNDAQAAYLEHVQHSGRDRLLLDAAAAMVAGRIPEAEGLLRARLRQAASDVAAMRMLAEVAARLDHNDDALHLLEACLELAPGFIEARWNHALILHRSNRPAEALAEIARVLELVPAHAGCLNLKAAVLCRIGNYAEALALYANLVRAHPDTVKLWLSYGHALKTADHTREAIAAYRRCTQLQPAFGEAWWSLANLKTFHFDAADIAAMAHALVQPGRGEDDRLHLEFALGKAHEDAGDCATSFHHYAQGNAIRRAQLPYDAGETTRRVEYIRSHYTKEFFAARAGSGCAAPDPIFIVGLPRAGSTLLEQILASHSQVEGTMELPELTALTGKLRLKAQPGAALPYHEALAAVDARGLRRLGEGYLAATRIQRKTARPFFIDKMPNNFMHVGLIHLILPHAKIIDARRQPLACGFSIFKQHFARGQAFSYGLADIGHYYRDYVALMAHFDAVLPGRVCRVDYEHLVADTEREVRRILAYCNLPFEPACLRFFDNPRPVRTASSEQVRQPIYKDGLEHWRDYAAWLQPLVEALGPALAGSLAGTGHAGA